MGPKSTEEGTVVIIPAYEPPTGFIDYLKLLSESGFLEIVVVNDGSGEEYHSVLKEISKIERVTLISYEKNRGKGHALKSAFSYSINKFSENTVFVTADCDGQHLASDVVAIANEATLNPEKLILGARDFSLSCVPKRSRTGNLFTRKMFSLLYGISLTDTQTGLRGFSYPLLRELLLIDGERFEYEMNMLIRLHKKHILIQEKKITTVYDTSNKSREKTSHFRTIKDSLRVLSVLFKNLGWYFLSSLISGVVEISAFFILTGIVLNLGWESSFLNMLIPTIGARLLSSIFNFTFNFKLVFGKKTKKSIARYYTLWSFQLAITYGFATFFSFLFTGLPLANIQKTALITICKSTSDLIIAIFSYQIQSRWVFGSDERNPLKFYGPYLRFWRAIYNIFSNKYRSEIVPPDKEPCVYISRHLDTHAPIKICQGLNFDVHFFVLNKFFGFKNVYRQYSTYTFTKRYNRRGIKLFLAKIGAFFSALWFAPIVKSIEAIPVFRGGSDSMITFRKSIEYLGRGESLIVFPDIDYTSTDKVSEIYTGFLFLEKLYYREYKKHLNFVIINVDDSEKKITEIGRVSFAGEDFKSELPSVADKIHTLLMNRH